MIQLKFNSNQIKMRQPLLILANLLLTVILFSQNIDVQIESIKIIKLFNETSDCNLSLSQSDDKLILIDANQKNKLFILKDKDLSFKEYDNPSLLDNSILLIEDEIFGFSGKKFQKHNTNSWSKDVSNTITRAAIKSSNNSILLLKTGLLGSVIERVNPSGKSSNNTSMRTSEMCSFRSIFQHIVSPKDGSVYLLGTGIEPSQKNKKQLAFTKMNSDLEKVWDSELAFSTDESILTYQIDNKETIHIVTELKSSSCNSTHQRLISFGQDGRLLTDKCLEPNFKDVKSVNVSNLDLKNGFLLKQNNENKLGSTSFAFYDNLGNHHFTFNIPFEFICDYKLFANNLIFTTNSKLYSLDLNSLNPDQRISNENLEYDIYPNPSKDFINITWGKEDKVYVYSALGVLIKEVRLSKGIGILSIQNFTDGMYFISDLEKSQKKPFVKTSSE